MFEELDLSVSQKWVPGRLLPASDMRGADQCEASTFSVHFVDPVQCVALAVRLATPNKNLLAGLTA